MSLFSGNGARKYAWYVQITRPLGTPRGRPISGCNIPSFQKSEKSEKFKTFSNYLYFALKGNFMHCMHHQLVLFAFVCSKDWNIIFQFKIYLIKLYVGIYNITNIIFCCLPSLNYCIVWFVCDRCSKYICFFYKPGTACILFLTSILVLNITCKCLPRSLSFFYSNVYSYTHASWYIFKLL